MGWGVTPKGDDDIRNIAADISDETSLAVFNKKLRSRYYGTDLSSSTVALQGEWSRRVL